MQTPQGVFCRAMIMLAAVVALPYFAVFGLEVPHELLAMIPREWIPPALQSNPAQTAATPATPPIQYRLDSPATANPLAPFIPGQAPGDVPAQMAAAPAARLLPISSSPGGGPPRAATSEVNQAIYEVPAPPDDGSLAVNGATSTGAVSMGAGDSPADIQRAFEAAFEGLGAIDTRLEPWGSELYRFQGRFAIGANSGLSRYFSAIDANPQIAMRNVLEQVEAWRADRR